METVFAHFANYANVNGALIELEDTGFTRNDISLVAQEGVLKNDEASHTASDAGTGAGIGGVVGLIAGLSAIAIPGIGPVLGAGSAIGGLLSGAGAGSLVGGVVGFFRDLFGTDDYATKYEKALENGHILLAVQAGPATSAAISDILATNGGEDVEVVVK